MTQNSMKVRRHAHLTLPSRSQATNQMRSHLTRVRDRE